MHENYVNTLAGNIVTVGWAAREYSLSGAKYPLAPGVVIYCNLAEYTPTTPTDTEVLLQTATDTGGVWTQDVRAKTAAELLSVEVAWVSQEMSWADEEMKKHNDGHSRLKGTIQQMKTFRNDLRNYIRDSKTDSPYIEGVKPTTRPGS